MSQTSSGRLGLLPPWWVPVVVAVLLAAALLAAGRAASALPLALTGVLLLPWLPVPVPDAFLVWSGPLTWWIWAGALAMVAARLLRGPASRLASMPARGAAGSAAAIAFLIYCGAAWQVSAVLPGGDEPHYLVITQSLLSDGDIQIENNHQRGDYRAYFEGTLRPDYLRRGQNRQIYSIHAPGLSALVAPAFAAGGYPGVVVFLALVSAIGSLLVWLTAYRLTGSPPAAWFGWAAVTLTVPFFFHAFAVYPDATGAALVMTAVYALVDLEMVPPALRPPSLLRWALHGLALAVLPWLHTRYALAAGVLGACLALRLLGTRAWRSLAALLAIPVASAAAWFSFFYVVYGRWSPAAPYGNYTQSQLSNIPRALPALLLDQQFGVLPNAPVYAFGLLGLAVLFRVRRRLAVELSLLLAGYLAAVSAYHMWWGGWSAPARFAVPVLLVLGVPAAVLWKERARAARAAALVALGVSVLITGSLTFARDGWLIFNTRDGFSRWLEWVSPLVDLPHALPSFLRDGARVALLQAALWVVIFTAAGWALAWFGRRNRYDGLENEPRHGDVTPAAPPVLAASLLFAVALMAGLSLNWRIAGTRAVTATTAQLELLRSYDPVLRPLGVSFRPLATGPAGGLVSRLRISKSTRRPAAPNEPLLALGDLPAGRYEADAGSVAAARGEIHAAVGRTDRPLQGWVFDPGAERSQVVLDLPVAVNAVTLTGDERARATVPDLALRPVTLLAAGERVVEERARRAARYGGLAVFSFDDYAYLEEPGLWIRGGTPVRLVLMAERAAGTARLLIRNGPVHNQVRLQSGSWSAALALDPRGERLVEVPLTAGVAMLEVRTERGFRPSESEPGSTDARYLGVWIEVGRD
ncbi:MAG: hypothetical protein EHM24_13525 [Acidobacteria bacterium]|nr:MAG: hypothetical protein EHM24_13525 [Acidobacteriota bacterium]